LEGTPQDNGRQTPVVLRSRFARESSMKSTDQQGMYGPKLLSCFRVAAGGCLTLDWPEKSTFAITRISSDIGLSDFTETVTP